MSNEFDYEILDRLKIPHCIINQDGDTADIKHVRYDKDGNREEWTAEGVKRPDGLWVETIDGKK